MMNNYENVTKTLFAGILLWSLLISVIGIIFFPGKLAFLLGVVLGTGMAIGLLYSMSHSIKISVMLVPQRAKRYVISRYFLRIICIAIGFILAMTFKQINLIGVILGIMGLKVSGYLVPVLSKYVK